MLGIEINLDRFERQLDFIRATQKYFYAAVIVGLAVILFFELIAPTWSLIRAERKQLAQFSKAVERKRHQDTNQRQVAETLDQWKERLAQSEQQFFSPLEFDEFSLELLPGLANRLGAKIVSLKTGVAKTDENGIGQMAMEVDISGDYRSIVNLIDECESFEKLMTVNKVQISRRSVDPYELRASIELMVMVKTQ